MTKFGTRCLSGVIVDQTGIIVGQNGIIVGLSRVLVGLSGVIVRLSCHNGSKCGHSGTN